VGIGSSLPKWVLNLTRVSPLGYSAIDLGQDGVFGVTLQPGRGRGEKPRVVRSAKYAGKPADSSVLKDIAKRCALPRHPTVAILGRGKYRILTLDTPAVLPAEMDRSVRLAIGPLVDFPVDAASVVWFPMPKALGQSAQLSVIAAEQSVSKETELAFRSAGLILEIIDVRETAQRNLSALFEKNQECLAMLQAEPEGLCLTFTQGGELYLDRFIAQPIDALGDLPPQEQADLLMRVATQIERSVEFVQRGYPTARVDRLLVVPTRGGMDLAGQLQQHLDLQIDTANLSQVVDLSQAPELQSLKDQAPFFNAVGAALRFNESSPA
jgi:MSHA biogenesis protein MshI